MESSWINVRILILFLSHEIERHGNSPKQLKATLSQTKRRAVRLRKNIRLFLTNSYWDNRMNINPP